MKKNLSTKQGGLSFKDQYLEKRSVFLVFKYLTY